MIAVGTQPARPAHGRLRRPHDHRLRRPAEARAARAALDDRRRRRRDRRRVRVDVRRARHEGHASSTSATARSTSSTARSARRSSTCCAAATSRSACARRSTRSSRSDGRARIRLGVGQGDHRPRPCSTRSGARARRTALGIEHTGLEADKRGRLTRSTSDFRTSVPHIFAVGDVAGRRASPRPRWSRAGSPPCTRSTQPVTHAARARPDRRLRHPRDRHGGRTEEQLTDDARPVRDRASRAGASSPAA